MLESVRFTTLFIGMRRWFFSLQKTGIFRFSLACMLRFHV
ncbi:hypothetical protein KPSA1_02415 [Pseudomonas syringae pv. actinidiae]|uniref:Uncharacterized protein n=1 Tax=Pseudomonas syringae pv. actinidiae TaxID=103796 RepID=A0A2V0Q8H7_PSESF|nr:hypothetical protein KPSA1_02415 [Pseudomonas syringae pv. actinidiae]